MPTVHVSARLIRWPGVCPCCGAPADTRVEVSATRRSGVRVIHRQRGIWDVPYCRACLRHVDAAPGINDLARRIDAERRPARTHARTAAVWVLAALAALPLACSGLLNLGHPATMAGLLMLAATFVAGAVLLTFPASKWDASARRDAVGRWERRLAEMEAELAERRREAPLSHACAAAGRIAVSYEGWEGTVHTFYFDSESYAAGFRRANAGKIVG